MDLDLDAELDAGDRLSIVSVDAILALLMLALAIGEILSASASFDISA
jgi:hypothetical protein